MKTVLFRCPECGQTYEGTPGDIGAQFECESCGKPFRLESAEESHGTRRPSGAACFWLMFRRAFAFRGRTRRREFWWAELFYWSCALAAGFVGGITGLGDLIYGLFGLATAIPILSMTVRRLHDSDKSGWWMLLAAVPVLQFAYFVWLCEDGTPGRNRFGPDPKRDERTET